MAEISATKSPYELARERFGRLIRVVRLRPFDQSTPEGRSAERHRRIALSSLSAMAAKFIGIITLLITVPLTVKYLGAERYGLWMTISSVIAMLACADLGIGLGLINILSDANGRDDRATAQRAVSSAWWILTAVGLGILLLFLACYPLIPWSRVFNLKSPLAIAEAGPTVMAFAFIFAFGLPLNAVSSIQSGYQQAFFSSLWTGVGNILALIGVLICASIKASLPLLVLAMAGAPLVSRICEAIVLFGYLRPALRPRLRLYKRASARQVLRTGLFFFALGLTGSIAFASDSLVITQVLGPEYVTEYSVTYRLFAIAPILLSFVLSALWPAYGEAAARGDVAWIRQTLFRSFKLAGAVAVPSAAFLVVFGRPIIYVWTRHEVMPGYLLLIGLGLWNCVMCLGGSLSMFLNGLNVIRFQLICASIMAVTNLTLSILLARWIGVSGVIFGTVISQIACTYIPAAFYVPKLLSSRLFVPQPAVEIVGV